MRSHKGDVDRTLGCLAAIPFRGRARRKKKGGRIFVCSGPVIRAQYRGNNARPDPPAVPCRDTGATANRNERNRSQTSPPGPCGLVKSGHRHGMAVRSSLGGMAPGHPAAHAARSGAGASGPIGATARGCANADAGRCTPKAPRRAAHTRGANPKFHGRHRGHEISMGATAGTENLMGAIARNGKTDIGPL